MVKFSRIKGMSQESVASKTAAEASRLIEEDLKLFQSLNMQMQIH